jgi:hypothetical protein
MPAGNRRPIQRRAEVGVLRLQFVQRGGVGVGRLALQRPCQVASPSQVAVLQLLCLTRIGQPVECVLADRLEQPIAPWVVQLDQRLVDQAGQHIQSGAVGYRIEGGNQVRGVQSEAAGEDAETAEQHPFLRSQKLMGPVHGSQECLLAWYHAPTVGGEEPETVVEGGCDALRGQAPYPGRRELESQRNAVQALADLGHCRAFSLDTRKSGSACTARSTNNLTAS